MKATGKPGEQDRRVKKLLLINPVGRKSGYLMSSFSRVPPLGLAYIAAVTPADWNVTITDENFGPVAGEEADLVGISAFTSNINRAYEIEDEYRKRDIKVVLGGIHVSMMPDEALQNADAVVIGEAEGIWADVLQDFENGRLAGKYVGPRIDLARNGVIPRRDLIDSRYLFHSSRLNPRLESDTPRPRHGRRYNAFRDSYSELEGPSKIKHPTEIL